MEGQGYARPSSERPRRILIIASTFPVRGSVGTPPFVGSLARQLADHFSVRIVTLFRGPKGGRQEYLEAGFEVVAVGRRSPGPIRVGLLSEWRSARSLLRELLLLIRWLLVAILQVKRFRPDVVHIHWGFPVPSVIRLAEAVRLIPRTAYVVSMHGSDVQLLTTRWRRIIRFGLRGARRVTCVNRAQKDLLTDLGLPDRAVSLLAMPIDPVFFNRPAHTEVSDGVTKLLFVGRLVPGKGVERLLRAFQTLEHSGNIELTVAGDGPLLESAAKRYSEVLFTGPLTSEQIAGAMRGATLVVLPFDGPEGLPVTVLEAMATRTPILLTRTDGVVDLESEGAHFFISSPGESSEDLGDSILLSLAELSSSKAEWERWLDRNFAVAQRYSAPQVGRRTAGLLSDACDLA